MTHIIHSIISQWKTDALAVGEEGVFISSDIEQRLTWLKNQQEKEANTYNYFLIRDGEEWASSLLEMAHALPNSEFVILKFRYISILQYFIYLVKLLSLKGV